MRLLRSGIVMWLGILFSANACGQVPDPLRLVPKEGDAVVKLENPRVLYDAIYGHEAFQDLLKIDAVAAFYDTSAVRRLNQLVVFFEKELGHDRLELLDKLSGGGAVLAARFEKKQVLLVVQAKDEELLKKFVALARKVLQQELARQDSADKLATTTYRDIETWQLGKNLYAARVGSALLFANQEAAFQEALDLHLNEAKDSLLNSPALAAVKKDLPKEPLIWGTLNLEKITKTQDVKNVLETLGIDPTTMVVMGGVVDVIKRSPYLSAGLAREGRDLRLSVVMPRGREGMAPLASMLLPQDKRGSLPMLQPPRVLSSTSYYLDLSKFWEDRHKILKLEQAKALDKFEADTGKYLKGIGLGTILQQAGKYQRVVITTPATSPYKVKPTLTAGSFGVILDMRDPEFAKSMGTILRGAALVGGFQYGVKMVEEKHAGQTLVTYYFPENGKFPGDDNNFRFNFSPCFTHVGNQFVIGSTLELGKDLVDCLLKESKEGTSSATQRTHVYGIGLAANLRIAEDLLVTQAILSQALPAAGAKKQYDDLIHLVERLGQVNFETSYGPHEFRFDAHWHYEKK